MEKEDIVYVGRPSKFLIVSEIIFMAIISAILLTALQILDAKFHINQPLPLTYICAGLLGFLALIRVVKAAHTVFSVKYTLSNDILEIKRGILSIRRDNLELYRVKDLSILQPLIYRFYSLGDLIIYSTDVTNPTITLLAIKDFEGLEKKLRELIDTNRRGDKVLETI